MTACIISHNEAIWSDAFGVGYAEGFCFTPAELDKHWMEKHGLPRSAEFKDALAALQVSPTESILEVGSSCGNQLLMLSDLGQTSLTGVEINPNVVNMARRRGAPVSQGNIRQLPFEDKSFDVVFSCCVLSHLEPEGRREAMREMIRVGRGRMFSTEYYTTPDCRHDEGFVWCVEWAEEWRGMGVEIIQEKVLPVGRPKRVTVVGRW